MFGMGDDDQKNDAAAPEMETAAPEAEAAPMADAGMSMDEGTEMPADDAAAAPEGEDPTGM